MSTQPTEKPDEAPMRQASVTGREKEWRILAEEASQEQNSEKLMEIVTELTRALDEEARKKKPE